MESTLDIFVKAIFSENMIFAYFLRYVFLPGGIKNGEDGSRTWSGSNLRIVGNRTSKLLVGKLLIEGRSIRSG